MGLANLLLLFTGDAAPALAAMGQVRGGLSGVGEQATATNAGILGFLGGVGRTAVAAVAGLAIAGAAIAGFGLGAANNLENAGHAAFEMAQAFGMAPTQASAWVAAGKSVGVTADEMDTGFKQLSRSLEGLELHNNAAQMRAYQKELTSTNEKQRDTAEAALMMAKASAPVQQILDDLGVTVTDANGKLLPMNEIMFRLSDAFAQLPEGTDKAAIAMKLFGRSGADMVPILDIGRRGITDYMNQAKSMGVVLSNDQVIAAQKAYLAHQRLSLSWDGFTNQIGAKFLPALTGLTNWLTATAVPSLERLSNWLSPRVSDGMKFVKDQFDKARPILKQVWDNIVAAWPTLQKLGDWLWNQVKPALEKVVPLVLTLALLLTNNLKTGLQWLLDHKDQVKLAIEALLAIKTAQTFVQTIQQIAGIFNLIGNSAVINAVKVSGAWIASSWASLMAWQRTAMWWLSIWLTQAINAARSAAAVALAWTVSAAQTIASWVAMAAAATAQAAIVAARWLVAQGAILAVRAATLLWMAAQWLLNVALDANPIGLVVLAVAALVAGVIWAYQNVGWFHDAVDFVWDKLKKLGDWLVKTLTPILKDIGQFFSDLGAGAKFLGDTLGKITGGGGGGGTHPPHNPRGAHEGGVFMNSTNRNLAEGGPEAVIPLSKLGNLGGNANMASLLQEIRDYIKAIALDNPPITGQMAVVRNG